MKTKTAILIFANSAEKEVERKSFLSAEIFYALNSQNLKTVSKFEIEYFHISEKKQVGNTFVAPFSNAITAIFYRGFEHIVHSFKAISALILRLLQKLCYLIKNIFSEKCFDLLKISSLQNFNKGSPPIFDSPRCSL